MTDTQSMTTQELVRRTLLDEHGDFLREAVALVAAQLMDAEMVRHEALSDRAGWETSPTGRRSGLRKLGAV